MAPNRLRIATAIATVSALTLTACGNDSREQATAPAPATKATEQAATSAAPPKGTAKPRGQSAGGRLNKSGQRGG
jgi:hypothetical protein